MHRTLFDLGPVSIHMYGVMLAIAFWLGIELSARAARESNLDETRVIDLGIVILISSVVGSRLLYVLSHLGEYQDDKLGVFRVWEGGLVFYGGLAAGVLFGIGYLVRKRMPILRVVDIVAPQIALGIAIARIGCFLNGCCFGSPSDLPWACRFPADSQAGWVMAGQAIHPTQIYASIANFILFLVLRRLLRAGYRSGTVFSWFLILYGCWRYAIDFLRHYEEQMQLNILGGHYTYSQIVSVIIVVIGLVLLARLRKRDAAL
jgi:phosphatidylglycerol:prolipoprotein diacylglycerol transferase